MSEEQAASFYEQRKNDIQKSIQKISKNKKKAVQSTPKSNLYSQNFPKNFLFKIKVIQLQANLLFK